MLFAHWHMYWMIGIAAHSFTTVFPPFLPVHKKSAQIDLKDNPR